MELLSLCLAVVSDRFPFARGQLFQPTPVMLDLDNPTTPASHSYKDKKPVGYHESATGFTHQGSAPSMGKSSIALLLLVFC
ncbi:MAG TPA: hypothetical protein VJ183_06380 [Chloroflexia bacterium]|nr:hypothetical protein [Chloroflexia bacterium]